MNELENIRGKKVLLGVSGSIAAYKAAALVSTLSKAGLKIQVVMTDKATDLVGPQTFQALSRKQVEKFWAKYPGKRPQILRGREVASITAFVCLDDDEFVASERLNLQTCTCL